MPTTCSTPKAGGRLDRSTPMPEPWSKPWSGSMPEIEQTISIEAQSLLVRKAVRVGIIGYGTVGRATAEILIRNAEEIRNRTDGISIEVTRLCRKTVVHEEAGVNGITVVSNWKQIVEAKDVDIVVETVGGTTTAYDIVRSSIENGKPIVTANKALIAHLGEEIFALADRRQVPGGIEATVGRGVRIIRPISELLAADPIKPV